MTIYTDVFGGANIYPSEISYSSYALTGDIALSWPEETSSNTNLATKIIDVVSSTGSWAFTLPAADKTGTGNTILFNNLSNQTVTVKDFDGVQVVTISPSELWQVYLSDNSTAAGSWRALQYGAEVSIANASSLAGTGIVAVGTLLSQSVPISTFNSNYTAGTSDRAEMFVWTGAGGTLNLPSAVTVGNNWFIYVRNGGTGALTVDPAGAVMINGLSTLILNPGDSAIIVSSGVDYYTIGLGKSAVFAFDYTSINVAGSGDYTLAGSELNRIAYSFTGVLTGNRDIIVPATVQQYWVTNSTTGAYNLTVKTAAGTGVVVAATARKILYCDGTDVVLADTGNITVPISVSDGGTGATTASSARINLGGGSTGISLFTAGDQATAWAALGIAPAGVVDGGVF